MVKIPSSPLPSPFVYSVFLLYCVVLENSRLPFLFKDSCEKAEREAEKFWKEEGVKTDRKEEKGSSRRRGK